MPLPDASRGLNKGLIRSATAIFSFTLLYLLTRHSYLIFHSFAEIFAVVVAWSVFVLAFNTHRFMKTGYFIFLGMGFLFTGLFGILHTLAYQGMGIFPGILDGNLGTQFWIAMRYLLAFTFLLAPFYIRKRPGVFPVFAGFFIVSSVLLLALLWRPVFPVCFIPGSGLTPFKKISEYIICVILIAALWLLNKNREAFHADVFRYLCWAVLLSIAAELFFTLYKDTFGLLTASGHLLEVLAFLAAYRAFIEKGLNHPQELIFFDMQRHEAALQARENEFRTLFEFSAIGLAQTDPETKQFTRINRKFCEITGYSEEELIGADCGTLAAPENKNPNGSCRCRPNNPRQKKFVHKNGEILWVEQTCTILRDKDGHPLYTLIALQDITSRVQAESALHESETRYRSLFNSMTEGFALHEIICDDQGVPCDYRFLDVNPAFEQMTGLKRNDVIHKTRNEILPGDDPRWITEYGAVALTGKSVRFEQYSEVFGRYYDVFTYCPSPRQFAAIFVDSTELKRMRDEVSYLASFPTMNRHPVTEADLDGHIFYANPAARRIFPNIEIMGKNHPWMADWDEVVRACKTPDAVLPDREVVVNYRYYQQTMSFVPASGRIRVYGVDISEQKRVEKALTRSMARLHAALLAGRAFIFEWFPEPDEIYRSENCAMVLGLDPEHCARDTRRNFMEQVHPGDRAGLMSVVQQLTPDKPDYKTEYRYTRIDGEVIWLEERGQAEFDKTGNLLQLHGITADITVLIEARRRETEAIAAASAARSAIDTVNAMDEGVVLMRLDGTILNANPAVLAMTGFRLQDVAGKKIRNLMPLVLDSDTLLLADTALGLIKQKQLPRLQTIRIRNPQGPARYVSPSVNFIEARQEGLPATVVLTLKDITELHENTQILERIFDNSHISIVYLDAQFNIVRANSTYAEACGKPVDFFPGKNHFALYPHEENERIFRRVADSGEPFAAYDKPFEFPDHPEWGVTYWNWSLQPVKDDRGRVEALIFCLQNTTLRKTALLALEKSERRYRELVENANSIIMRITQDHRITFFNEYAQKFFGFSAEEVLGKSVLGTITPLIDSAGNDLRKMTEAISAYPALYATNENENMCKNGQRVWISWTNKVIRDGKGNIAEILCVGTDSTARKRIQDENLRYQERLRHLAEQLAASEEEERWQISRYIHDTIVQNLSLSSIKLGSLQRSLTETGSDQNTASLQTTRNLIDDAIAECRTVMSELTPPLLYELGLPPALIELAEHLKEKHGVSIAIEKTGPLDPMSNTLRGLLFQSARELVMNALKHAGCSSIGIAITQLEDGVQICVRDNGCGFDSSRLTHRATKHGGFGLFGVRERVENLGGRLNIESSPGLGTEVRIFMPFLNDRPLQGNPA